MTLSQISLPLSSIPSTVTTQNKTPSNPCLKKSVKITKGSSLALLFCFTLCTMMSRPSPPATLQMVSTSPLESSTGTQDPVWQPPPCCLPGVWGSTHDTTMASALGAAEAHHGPRANSWSSKNGNVRSPLSCTLGVNSKSKHKTFTQIKLQGRLWKPSKWGMAGDLTFQGIAFLLRPFSSLQVWTSHAQLQAAVEHEIKTFPASSSAPLTHFPTWMLPECSPNLLCSPKPPGSANVCPELVLGQNLTFSASCPRWNRAFSSAWLQSISCVIVYTPSFSRFPPRQGQWLTQICIHLGPSSWEAHLLICSQQMSI